MSDTQDIPLTLIYARQNNREEFDQAKLEGLAADIKANGLLQPIGIEPDGSGRYALIWGERRYRACVLAGLETVAAVVKVGLTRLESLAATIKENDNREAVSPIEQGKGYQAMMDHGASVEYIAGVIGKKGEIGRKYVQDRLDLLKLRPDMQKLVHDGQLTIGYAVHLVKLDTNRQVIAMREFNGNPSPTVKWFAAVCGDLLAQQQQQGLFGWGYSDQVNDQAPAKMVLPPDPARYRPSFSSGNMRQSVAGELAKWQAAGEGWSRLGKDSKVESCRAICQVLECWLESLPVVVEVDQAAERVAGLLSGRGTMTTREILQYANMTTNEAGPVLERMETAGRIAKEKAGRGWRYSLAAVA